MPATMSDKFEIGDRVMVSEGGHGLSGVVKHASFDRIGRNQVLVKHDAGGPCLHSPRHELRRCPQCPEYYDEKDVELA